MRAVAARSAWVRLRSWRSRRIAWPRALGFRRGMSELELERGSAFTEIAPHRQELCIFRGSAAAQSPLQYRNE